MKNERKVNEKPGKKKKAAVAALALTTIAAVGGVAVFCLKPQKVEENDKDLNGMDIAAMQQGVVYAYGVTSIATDEVTFPITDLDNSLEIEAVYISSGSQVTDQMPLAKLTEESIENVRLELQEDLRAAELAYRAGAIEYEQNKIVAYYDKETTLLQGEQADAVYKETISGLADQVQRAKEELDEANAQIAEYQTALTNNSYYEDYQVAYYKDLYDENLELLKDYMEKWNVSWSEVTTGRGGMQIGSDPSRSQYVSILSSLYKVLEQNLKDYENALSGYEQALEDAQFNIQTLKLQINSLEQSYAQVQESYDSSISNAELTKAKSISNAEKAENDYEAIMEKDLADYESLKEAYENARENMDLFEQLIVDGCLYTTQSGEVLRAGLRAGGSITGESRLFTINDKEDMRITVSVDQSDIASIQVGDSAIVQTEAGGIYRGSVSAVNPISTSDSKTSITYNVTVKLNGASTSLEANETVVVYFGMEG